MTDYVVNRGLRIAYDVAGRGDEVVVLLHGLGQRRTDWEECGYVEGLAGRFQVICIDSLGHGESDAPNDCSLDRAVSVPETLLQSSTPSARQRLTSSVTRWVGGLRQPCLSTPRSA